MTSLSTLSKSISHSHLRRAAFALALSCVLATITAQPAQAQTLVPLHQFTGGVDGSVPLAGLTIDRAGNLYGTTLKGGDFMGNCMGSNGCGTVFKILHRGTGWVFMPLYSFLGGNDGQWPFAGVTVGPNGSLYGATSGSGVTLGTCNGMGSCGTVFNVRPTPNVPANASAPWLETVLYSFAGGADGAFPQYGSNVIFDNAGNLYGTTVAGGGAGTVYKLTPSGEGQWAETILYTFMGGNDGGAPLGLVFDTSGNLYGTTYGGGTYDCGTVFELVPSGSGWTKSTIYNFNPGVGDGCHSFAGLTFDGSNHFFGTNYYGGVNGGGTAFELSPNGQGGWTEAVIYSFSDHTGNGLEGGLTLDTAGNLYGTMFLGGNGGLGEVFKLAPSGGNWQYTDLHDFNGQDDGLEPSGSLAIDANGNVYGVSSQGGTHGHGVAWEIMP